MAASLSIRGIARELAEYHLELPEPALAQLSTYLELLLRWNRRVNLTGLRQPRAIVRRLFAESLYLTRVLEVRGWLVDIGSGAGFPGLALKLAVPDLRVTLVEARQRKCAFLKETARECGFSAVDVVCDRFEDWVRRWQHETKSDCATTREVSMNKKLLKAMAAILGPGGHVVLSTSCGIADEIRRIPGPFLWKDAKPIPHAGGDVVLVGIAKENI